MAQPGTHRSGSAVGLMLLLALWELAGQLRWVGDGALPAPSQILVQWWADRADYPAHVLGTLRTSALGFFFGNLVAVAVGLLMVWWRPAQRLLGGVNVAVFAMPAIAIVPVLVIALEGDTPRVVLAALSVYYPTMVALVLGLTQVDPRLCDLVRVYGGGDAAVLRWVRLRAGLPTLLAGLQVAAPAAVLGSLLAEFGSGGNAGLGTYLIGSLGRADPPRLWGIGLTATAISAAAYLAVGWVARTFAGHTQSASLTVGQITPPRAEQWWLRLSLGLVAAALPLLLWSLAVAWAQWSGVSEVVVRGPWGVAEHLMWSEDAGDNRQRLIDALAQTVPYALVGMALGLGVAFALAVVTTVWRALGDTLLPVSLVTQSMPLVALAPLIVLVFGRDTVGILAITVSVTFFPAFVTIAQGLQNVPATAHDLVRAYGGGQREWLWRVAIPWATPYLFASARLAAPRAFLGVMIAEWLATGTGIGNLLNESRGMLDYGMIWSVALVSVLVAVLLHALTAALERHVLRRFAFATA